MFENNSLFRKYSLRDYRFRLVICVLILSVLGIIVIGSANPSYRNKQIMGVVLGIFMMVIISFIDYKSLLRLYRIWWILMVIILAAVLTPLGREVNGAQRWIQIGSLQFQPSDFAKVLLIVVLAAFFSKYKSRINEGKTILAALILFAIPAFLIFREPNLSTTIIVTLIFITLLFIAGLSYKIVLRVLAVCIPVVIVGLILLVNRLLPLQDYQYQRILAFVNPSEYSDGTFQQLYSIRAIGSGQLWGKGLYNHSFTSVKNGNFISEPQTDFIFAIVGEEMGFIGSLIIIALLFVIVFECIMVARNAKDLGGRLICSGVAAWIGFQGFVNISVASGMMPNTGVPLPFVSYGLTSLISLFIGVGLVLNVGLQARKYGTGDI